MLGYKKFFENNNDLDPKIQILNQIKDVFLEIEDKFDLQLAYNYYSYVPRPKKEYPLNFHVPSYIAQPEKQTYHGYIIYDEYGKKVDIFTSPNYYKKGYFVVEDIGTTDDYIININLEDINDCILQCVNRAKSVIDTKMEINVDKNMVVAVIFKIL